VLKPEVALVILSSVAFALERKRRSLLVAEVAGPTRRAAFPVGSEHAR
jgi:hypothetical protein